MEYCNFASSSEGNVSYIRGGNTRILLDCGKNLRYIENALSQIGSSAADIEAIVISHEHADHVSALPKFLKVYGPRLYISLPSYMALAPQLASLDESKLTIIEEAGDIVIGDIRLRPYEVSHDAARTLGFKIEAESSMAFFTDLGVFKEGLIEELRNIKLLVMESNYDDDMLLSGPYPPFLKQRIRSNKGHLSNKAAAEAILNIYKAHAPAYIFLAHISKHNNLPWLALNETQTKMAEFGLKNGLDYRLDAHYDNALSGLISF